MFTVILHLLVRSLDVTLWTEVAEINLIEEVGEVHFIDEHSHIIKLPIVNRNGDSLVEYKECSYFRNSS